MRTKVSQPGRSIQPISFFFFLNKRYLDADFINHWNLLNSRQRDSFVQFFFCTFFIGHIHSSNSNSRSSFSNEWILIFTLSEHSVDQDHSFVLLTA
jgi:hypothetical protein